MILDDLKWRGLFADCTDEEGLGQRLAEGQVTLYVGFDPTAESLHVGNLVPLLALRRFQLDGHKPIALAGGATGLIGDPSGKSQEREMVTPEVLEGRVAKIKTQLEKLLDFEVKSNPARLVDNGDWVKPISFIDFLRDVGKHFSVNVMVAKESVKARMEGAGISFTEFSYMLLQAYDFYHLHQTEDCELQVGGSDQWGNIVAGMELIRRKASASSYGLTLPLLTKADGSKFGKSAGGAIWLDPEMTSVYRYYQFWINADDADVVKFLKYFTFLDHDQIDDLAAKHEEAPHKREAHRALAQEMTRLIHGADALADAERASEILFGGGLDGITEATFNNVAGEVPTKEVAPDFFGGDGAELINLLVESGLSASKSQARKDIKGGGVYINNERQSDEQRTVTASELLFDRHLLLRRGKKNYAVITLGK